MFECGFEVFDDLLGEDIGVGKLVGFFQAFVPEPEDVEAGFVAVDKFFVIVSAPAAVRIPFGPSRRPLIVILRIIALDKFVEVLLLQWIGLESDVLVGLEIVDPELLRPQRFTGGLLVEEKDIRFDTLSIEQAGRKTQKGVNFAFVQ